MSLFVKVFTNFYAHRKTLRLRSCIGDDAFWIPPRLWAYAADNQPDGDFSDYSAEELAYVLGYTKDAPSMLQALLKAGFLDEDRKIHDWAVYNGYHELYAERAKKAANARWEKERTKEKSRTDRRGEEPSIASSIASSITVNGNTAPLRFPKDFQTVIEVAEKEREKLKAKGAHINAHGTEWHDDKLRKEFVELGGKVKTWKKQMLSL